MCDLWTRSHCGRFLSYHFGSVVTLWPSFPNSLSGPFEAVVVGDSVSLHSYNSSSSGSSSILLVLLLLLVVVVVAVVVTTTIATTTKTVKQSRCRPGVAQRVPGS